MKLGILGQGRLGSSMAPLLRAAGHEVTTWSRGQAFPRCEVAWICVSDGAIAEVAAALPAGPVVLHASGATDLGPVSAHAEHGSLHPLQSFPGPDLALPPLSGVPAAIAGTPRALEVARALATDLGMQAFEVPGDRRLYHASAVVAGNFATTLLAAASELLSQAGVPSDRAPALLAPLAIASIQQAALRGPQRALTGPHVRGDEAVIRAHERAIAELVPELSELYRILGEETTRLAGAFPPDEGA
jgi:predicted short-subunit dehydrogenase-like oxidoreductase (DUF2520 family)